MEGEGHYLALLKKGGRLSDCSEKKKDSKKGGKTAGKSWKSFSGTFPGKPEASRLDIHGERVYYMPKGLPKLNGVRLFKNRIAARRT